MSTTIIIRQTDPRPAIAALRRLADLLECGRYVEVGGGIHIHGEYGEERLVVRSDLVLQVSRTVQ